MWLRMRMQDVRLILHFSGMLIVGLGFAMTIPLVTALVFSEWGPALDYFAGIGVALTLGALMVNAHVEKMHVTHAHALAITAFAWAAAAAVAAVPLSLSGNYPTYLDAAFDAISGLTVSGLTTVVDLDHLAHSHNMWRHLTQFIGGQGIVVAAISLTIGMRGGAYSLYVAEGRDERILPNVYSTRRASSGPSPQPTSRRVRSLCSPYSGLWICHSNAACCMPSGSRWQRSIRAASPHSG